MLRKSLAMTVAAVMLHMVLVVQPASARSKADRQAKLAAQVKRKLSTFGTGENARLAIRLRNKAL